MFRCRICNSCKSGLIRWRKSNMKTRFGWMASVCAVAVSGCRTADLDLMAQYADGVASGRADMVCAAVVERADEVSQAQLMWTLDAAAAKSLVGDLPESTRLFDRAEDILEENDRTGAVYRGANQALSFLSDDWALDYDCGGTERTFCNIYKAQNYTAQGNRAAANVELNRALVRQERWLDVCRDRMAREQAKIDADVAGYANQEDQAFTGHFASVWASAELKSGLHAAYGFNPMDGGRPTFLAESRFMNPYLCHLAGVLKRLTMSTGGEAYLKDAARLLPRHPVVANDWSEAVAGTRPQNQVWIYVEDGMCARPEAVVIPFPDVIPLQRQYAPDAAFYLPRLTPRPASGVAYSVAGGAFAPLLDVDASLSADFRVRLNGIVAREVAKRVAQVGTEIASGAARDVALGVALYKDAKGKKDDARTAAIVAAGSALVNLGVTAWNAATQTVDVRCWSALPQRVLVARVARPADGKVVVGAGAETLTVPVEEGNAIVWIRKPSQAAPAVVRTFSAGSRP